MKTLTIITATKNSELRLDACLNSINIAIKNSSFSVSQIVVDGYSSDNTLSIISKLAPSAKLIQLKPSGIYEALNLAIKYVNSEYLMYVHSDDELDDNFLREMYFAIMLDQEASIFYGTVRFINFTGKDLFERAPPYLVKCIQKKKNLIFHPNAIYRVSDEKKFLYEPELGLGADHDHINKLLYIVNVRTVRCKKAIYKFRISSLSSTINSKKSYSLISRIAGIYLNLYETNLLSRGFKKFFMNISYWKM
jgi:glycosyltransferase involved in cell wall biosynthesis